MKFYIETFGCTANFGDSQQTAAALIRLGHEPAPLEQADAVIVNTCAVTARTERKILKRLRELEGDRLVIGGCLATALPGSLGGIGCKMQLRQLGSRSAAEIAALFCTASSRPHSIIPSSIMFHNRDSTAIINIAEGCSGSCTYCIVRRARGRLASKSMEDVVEEARCLAGMGVAEIQIAAQDTASYGADIGSSLPQLLDRLAGLPGDFMVRVGMMNPDSLMPHIDEMIRVLQSPRIFRFLHIPLQSGSDDVLKRMGRRYTAQDFINIVKILRASLPDISINTDVICGFPGETDEDFGETMDAVRLVQPDKVNVTRFSPRPGTTAARLYDMPDRIKKQRSRELTRLWIEIAAARNSSYVGQVMDAVVTEWGRGATMKARSANYVGIVISGAPDTGRLCRVNIVESNPFYLNGILQL